MGRCKLGYLPVRGDGLPGHGTQITLEEVPDVNPGCFILDQEHSRPGWGPMQAGDSTAVGAAVPLCQGVLGGQLVEPDAAIGAASL